ncbi:unnamed protein product [Lactuca saligna]|uniref:K Homology domain-containing protein n=1 Tax=Lactuca saligna TaxID=75948 RepID=A0AA35ZXE5_LACSI|nr:unnamed protein product [Lactuca saligna]
MAEENFDGQETEVMPENSVPVEVEVSENEESEEVETEITEKEQGDAAMEIPAEKKWPGWPGENVFRLLVPVHKVGTIIGRKGEYIKKTCEETKARIKILDGPPGTMERCVLISAKEEPDASIPPAMDGLLKIHKRVTDVDADPTHPPAGGTISTRLLVAATQAGNLIGKQGATIKTIQDSSGCVIRVLGQENLPVIALPDDSVVEVQGEREGVHKAVELIASHLRKFLVDRSVIGIFEKQMQMPSGRGNQEMAAAPQPWAAPPAPPAQNFPGGGPGYRPAQFMPPQHQFDNYYPPPAMDNQPPRQLPPSYGRDTASMGMHMAQQELMVSKVSQNMQVPLTYADAVIGTSGANISYIRRASGATIAIQESRGNPDEMTVEINGSASQVQTAQQLIHNFMADAAQNPTAAAAAAPPVVATTQGVGGGYNQYPGYPSQPAPPGHPPAAGGDYGSAPMYGGSYGY